MPSKKQRTKMNQSKSMTSKTKQQISLMKALTQKMGLMPENIDEFEFNILEIGDCKPIVISVEYWTDRERSAENHYIKNIPDHKPNILNMVAAKLAELVREQNIN